MTSKILIERKFKEVPSPQNLQLIDELRIKALQQRGYIGGETVISYDGRDVLVVTSWASLEDWERWVNSEERTDLENKLASDLEAPAKFRAFKSMVDFRRRQDSETWHWSKECPNYPKEKDILIKHIKPEAVFLCEDCNEKEPLNESP